MRKLLVLADGLHLQDGVHLKLGKILSLAIFLMVLFGSGQQAKSEDGVIWTKNFLPYKLLNAVFSPDDQYIYATCTDIYYVIKYDLQGNILDTIKNVGGIRKFSEDGKYFWNYNGDKYDANTFERLYSFGGGGYNIYGWNFEVNQNANIAIACAYGKEKRTQYRVFFDSNLIVLNLSDMKIQRFTSYPDNQEFGFSKASIHPDGQRAAFLVSSEIINEGSYYPVTDKMRIEIWKIPEFIKEKEINIQIPASSTPLILRYSPDGSVLGYQHDGKLTLYSTTDYSVVWESGEIYAWNFAFSPDMKYIYIAEDIHGVIKYAYESKTKIASFWQAIGSIFLNFSKNNNYLLLSSSDWKIVFADNNFTSITDPFFTNEYKTTLIQNQTNNNYQLQIEATQPNIVNYFISDAIGNILIPNLTQNLEQGLNLFDIETSTLPSGSYFINIEIAGHSQTLKFIVVR